MRKRARHLAGLFAIALLASGCSGQAGETATSRAKAETIRSTQTEQGAMKIRIIANGREMTAELEGSAAARDFATLLPIDLSLRDYNGTEKIAELPSHLPVEGAPEGIDPAVGDIAYFAPWGNLALFYRDFGYSRGLIRLGRIDGDMEALAGSNAVFVRIERLSATPTD